MTTENEFHIALDVIKIGLLTESIQSKKVHEAVETIYKMIMSGELRK